MKIILLIESNPDILENLAEGLEMEGYKVITTSNGKTGVELARKHLPHLIICDDFMFEMDGKEIMDLLLNNDKTKNIPVIFSSTHPQKIDKLRALKLGADDYIVKPYGLESLYKITAKYINSGSKRTMR